MMPLFTRPQVLSCQHKWRREWTIRENLYRHFADSSPVRLVTPQPRGFGRPAAPLLEHLTPETHPMLAEVIAIGDELTSGQRLDTNSKWLSERLGDLGIRVVYHTTVADDLAANIQVFQAAIERADVIVATGGLGPTADDLTRDAVASAAHTELELHQPSLEHIRSLFARRGSEMPERNKVQAYLPKGSNVVPNPHGSAPGIDFELPRPGRPASRVFALPGVPAEMREMWTASVEPAIRRWLGADASVTCHRRVKCFGAGESAIEAMLPDLVRRGRTPSVGITASQATITLRVTATDVSRDACLAQMEPTLQTIRECLGALVYGEEDDELQDVVIRLLENSKASLSTVEWGTGGIVSNWLDDADRDGSRYLGGTILRNHRALQSKGLAATATETELEAIVTTMAGGCRGDFDSDYALAIGPFPSAEPASTRPGQLHLAVADRERVVHQAVGFGGHPEIVRARSAKQALAFLRDRLANA